MLFGFEPWHEFQIEAKSVSDLREVRKIPVSDICSRENKLTKEQKEILCKMLAPDYDERFDSVEEVIFAISDNLKRSYQDNKEARVGMKEELDVEAAVVEKDTDSDLPQGFDAVAGMNSVKEMLSEEVMYVLKNPEKVKKYRLKVPNGMLFYGPPGCGKTFIAEKFAQETRLPMIMVKASDIGSTYVHGTQGKIKELFDKACAKAPTILCFDELDGMVPDRSRVTSEAISGEVNEFLTQLNNCSDRGIFVIGTTNRPNMIDPAILRSGRLDNMVYIPMPDEEARKDLFRIHLMGRPLDEAVDFDELARATEGYVASDIELIVNKAALEASRNDELISQEVLMKRVSITRRSVSDKDMAFYDEMNRQMQSLPKKEERRKIGFVTGY
jgi:transitional endoplasmic reticulum ATPase